MLLQKFPPAYIQVAKLVELPDLSTYALVCELYVVTHSFFLAPKARNSIASLGDAPAFIEPESAALKARFTANRM
jgi:hypothetical protein